MKLTNAQIFDLACSLEGLMEQTLPVKLAFQISQIFLSLESLRRSIALVIEKLPKGENGVPEEEPFTELLAIENEVAIEPIDFLSLESLRRSIALVIEKLPKGENGVPEEEPFTELLAIENEVAIEPIDSAELFKALDTMTPRQAMALVPILKGGGQ